MRFDNRVAVVTGGSRGIGFATVRAFLREGAAVILCASRQETADKAVAQLREEFPGAAVEAAPLVAVRIGRRWRLTVHRACADLCGPQQRYQ